MKTDDLAVALLWMSCGGDARASARTMRDFFRTAARGEQLRKGARARARTLAKLLARLRPAA